MKKLILATVIALSNIAMAADLPELHKIEEVTLSAPYSCGGSYSRSALFLSDYSKKRNSPDLLYNGACRSGNTISASTAGDDFTVIADLGDVRLEDVSAHKAMNFQNISGQDNSFKQDQPVVLNHTYAILISKSEIRALYVIKVVAYRPDGAMTIQYAVKSYSIQKSESKSPGFEWEKGNKGSANPNAINFINQDEMGEDLILSIVGSSFNGVTTTGRTSTGELRISVYSNYGELNYFNSRGQLVFTQRVSSDEVRGLEKALRNANSTCPADFTISRRLRQVTKVVSKCVPFAQTNVSTREG